MKFRHIFILLIVVPVSVFGFLCGDHDGGNDAEDVCIVENESGCSMADDCCDCEGDEIPSCSGSGSCGCCIDDGGYGCNFAGQCCACPEGFALGCNATSQVPVGTCSCTPIVSYRRVLSEFDEDSLFTLMEGEEHQEHLAMYEAKKSNKDKSPGVCHHSSSKLHGVETSHEECFSEDNKVDAASGHVHEPHIIAFEPWIEPTQIEGMKLLASNPGFWSIKDFMDEKEVQQVKDLVHKYGKTKGQFGPCKHDQREASNAHPMTGKMCFKISPEHVCDGPYDVSDCAVSTEAEDVPFINHIVSRFRALWPGFEPMPYLKFQLATGGTPPVDLHTDTEKVISFVLYLSDGGAAMLFPHADLTVVPETGTAHTWLNHLDDHGTRNPFSDHAVQAHPSGTGGRLVMLMEVPTGSITSAQE